MADASPLYWFPFEVGAWLKSPAVASIATSARMA